MKKLVMVIVIIIALVAIGWYGWNNMGGSLSQSPEDMLADMQQNMMEVDSAHFTGGVNFEGTYNSNLVPTSEFLPMDGTTENTVQKGVFMVDITGAFAEDGEEEYKGYMDTAIGYEMDGKMGNILLSTRSVGGTSYLQAGKLEIPMDGDNAEILNIVSGLVLNKWISLPEVEESEGDTTDVDQKVKDLFYQLKFLTNLNVEGTERIRGNNTAHITGNFNREDMRVFMIESRELSDDTMTEEEQNDLMTSLDIIDGLSLDVWIGVSDSLLYKVQLAGPVVEKTQGIDGNLNAMFELYDYDTSVKVIAPEGSVTFEELVGQIMGAMMFGMMGDIDLDMVDFEGAIGDLEMPIE